LSFGVGNFITKD